MTDKKIPQEGKRDSTKSKSRYSGMDSYHEEEKRLRAELERTRDSYAEEKEAHGKTEGELNALLANKKIYEDAAANRDETVNGLNRDVDNLKGELDETNNRLDNALSAFEAEKHENDNAARSIQTLQNQLETKERYVSNFRKKEGKLVLYVWIAAIAGVAGTIWGSLGNPIPFAGDDADDYRSPSGKTANEQMTSCILQKQYGGKEPALANSARWLTGKPDFFLIPETTKTKRNEGVLLSNLEYKRDWKSVTLTGNLTNENNRPLNYAGVKGFLIAPIRGTEKCRIIWSGTIEKRSTRRSYGNRSDPVVPSNGTLSVTMTGSLPKNVPTLEGAKWYFLDFWAY